MHGPSVKIILRGLVRRGGTAVCDSDRVSSLRRGVRLVVWILVLSLNALIKLILCAIL